MARPFIEGKWIHLVVAKSVTIGSCVESEPITGAALLY